MIKSASSSTNTIAIDGRTTANNEKQQCYSLKMVSLFLEFNARTHHQYQFKPSQTKQATIQPTDQH